MKFINKLFIALFISFALVSCKKDGILNELPSIECAADLAVTALDAPEKVKSGDFISIICVIKNLADNYDSCADSGKGTARIICAFSPTFQENFSEYAVFDDTTVPLENSYRSGEGQEDEMYMPTNQGPGYYAMKVEVDSDNESSSSRSKKNNVKAIVINAE